MFCRQRPAHVHEIAEGQAHAGHGAGEVVISRIAESGPGLSPKSKCWIRSASRSNTSKGAAVRRAASQMTGSRSSTGKGPGRLCAHPGAPGGEHLRWAPGGEIKQGLFPEGGEVDQPLLTLNRSGSARRDDAAGQPRSHLLLQPGENGVIEADSMGRRLSCSKLGRRSGSVASGVPTSSNSTSWL